MTPTEYRYEDAAELCRLGCKAIQIEQFDSARRFFELAAQMGAREAEVSLELMYNQGYIHQQRADYYQVATQAYPVFKTEQESFTGRHVALKKRPQIKVSYYLN